MEKTIAFNVNGRASTVTTDPSRPLLEVLREDLGLTGPKYGCGEGLCGACTVLINGVAVQACITAVKQADGQGILTIEGLGSEGQLHPVQEAFLAAGALQCGYCTPGMIMGVVDLLGRNPRPTDAEILDRLDTHLCRCGGYTRILHAIKRAASGAGGGQS